MNMKIMSLLAGVAILFPLCVRSAAAGTGEATKPFEEAPKIEETKEEAAKKWAEMSRKERLKASREAAEKRAKADLEARGWYKKPVKPAKTSAQEEAAKSEKLEKSKSDLE